MLKFSRRLKQELVYSMYNGAIMGPLLFIIEYKADKLHRRRPLLLAEKEHLKQSKRTARKSVLSVSMFNSLVLVGFDLFVFLREHFEVKGEHDDWRQIPVA